MMRCEMVALHQALVEVRLLGATSRLSPPAGQRSFMRGSFQTANSPPTESYKTGIQKMKKLILASVSVALLGIASVSAPALAMPAHGLKVGAISDVEAVQYRHRMRPHVCRTERIVRRGPYGRRVVTTRRVCR